MTFLLVFGPIVCWLLLLAYAICKAAASGDRWSREEAEVVERERRDRDGLDYFAEPVRARRLERVK